MASDAVIDRIVNLLRLAAGSDGTPEGDNAAEHARRLMDRHGVQVILGDVPPEEQPRSREVGADFGSYDSREHWLEQITHLVGWIYDLAPVWYVTDKGRIGLIVFDVYGDAERLQAAQEIFDRLVRIVHFQPMPKYLLHNVEPGRAQSIFRAGMAHTIVTRMARIGKIPRVDDPELPSNDEVVALVPVKLHRRPRHPFVDPAIDVPIQGSEDDWAQGAEATLFHYGTQAGARAYLPEPSVSSGSPR